MVIFLLLLVLWFLPGSALADGMLLLPETAFGSHELGLIVNESDPLSRQVADYYRKQRDIPEQNIIHVRFMPEHATLSPSVFRQVYEIVQSKTPPQVQAFALAWMRPYKVGCMSITSAFATGYDQNYCAKEKLQDMPCGISGASPYFASATWHPYQDFRIRPAMMLAAASLDDAKRLIDRGVAADGSFPHGTAYLLSTSDPNRTVRDKGFASIEQALGAIINVEVLEQDSLNDRDDVLFYFTGLTRVEGLESLGFVPGAVADHLTSGGGHMKSPERGGQMSSLRWLEAGATGSYGTVIEPCNFTTKFPRPGLVMAAYLGGVSLIEAYWKSVAWPGEGLFIGEPLAAPFYRSYVAFKGDSVSFALNQFRPGNYMLEAADFPVGPFQGTGKAVRIDRPVGEVTIDGLDKSYYRLAKIRVNSGFGLPAHTIGKPENSSPEY